MGCGNCAAFQKRWIVEAYYEARPAPHNSPEKQVGFRHHIYVSKIGGWSSFGTGTSRGPGRRPFTKRWLLTSLKWLMTSRHSNQGICLCMRRLVLSCRVVKTGATIAPQKSPECDLISELVGEHPTTSYPSLS